MIHLKDADYVIFINNILDYTCVFSCSVVSDSATPRTAACQAPLSMEFPRQEYWSGLSFPSPGDLPDPGIEPRSLALAGRFFTAEPPEELKGKADRIPNCTYFVYELCKNVLKEQNNNAECWQSILVSGGTWGREK